MPANARQAKLVDYIFFVISTFIFVLSITVILYAIFTDQTELSENLGRFMNNYTNIVAFIIVFLSLYLLALLEGLLVALVELKRQSPDTYRQEYPRAFRLGELVTRGNNVERFIMGRQFLVTFLSFVAARVSTIHIDKEFFLFPLPDSVNAALFETSFLAVYLVVILAQLVPEVLASKYPMQFLNSRVMMPCYYVCVFIEYIGTTHCTWLLVWLFEAFLCLTPEPPPGNQHGEVDDEDPPPTDRHHQADAQHGSSSGIDSDESHSLETSTDPTPRTPLLESMPLSRRT